MVVTDGRGREGDDRRRPRRSSTSLQEKLKAFDAKKPPPLPVAMGLTDRPGPPPKTYLLERGELANRAAEVQPGFPAVLSPGGKPAPADGRAAAEQHRPAAGAGEVDRQSRTTR